MSLAFLPALAIPVGVAIVGGISAMWASTRIRNHMDPTDPSKYDGRARQLAEVLRDRENASDWGGNDGIVAAQYIRDMKASVKLDLIRSGTDPETLRETLRGLQKARVEKYRENPSTLSALTILANPFREKSILGAVGDFGEAPKRVFDLGASRAKGEATTIGKFAADIAGLEPGSIAYSIVSGTLDAAGVMFADPTLAAGKAAKVQKLGRTANQARWGPVLTRVLGHNGARSVEQVLELPRVERFFQEAAKIKSPSRIKHLAAASGGPLSEALAQKVAALDNVDDIRKAFADDVLGWAGGAPQWMFMGKGREGAAAFVKRMPILRLTGRMSNGGRLHANDPAFYDDLQRGAEMLYGPGKEVEGLDALRTSVDLSTDAGRVAAVAKANEYMNEGYVAFGARYGVDGDVVRAELAKIQKKSGTHPSSHPQAFGAHSPGVDAARDVPFWETQLNQQVWVPSYPEIVELSAALSKHSKTLKTGLAAKELLEALERPIRKLWVMTGANVAKNLIEEIFFLAGDVAHGPAFAKETAKSFVRNIREKSLAPFHRSIAPGAMVVDDLSEITVAAGAALDPGAGVKVLTANDPIIDEALVRRAAKYGMPDKLRNKHTLSQATIYEGPVPKGAVDEVRKGETYDGHVFSYFNADDANYNMARHHTINNQILNDRVAQMHLAHWDDPDEATRVIKDWFKTDEGKHYLSLLEHDPNRIANSRKRIEAVITPDLIPHARTGEVPWEALVESPNKPNGIYGPGMTQDMLDAKQIASLGKRFTNKFYGVAGGVVDRIGREKAFKVQFDANYDRILDLVKKEKALGKTVSVDDVAAAAHDITVRNIFASIDTPSNRTKFDFWANTWIPFVDAQTRFWKRWGKRAIDNPAAVEKARLLMGAGQDIGWVDEDDRGNMVVNIPIVAPFFSLITRVPTSITKDWFGVTVDRRAKGPAGELAKSLVPMGLPFSTDVIPSFGAIAKLSVSGLAQDRPSLEWMQNAVFGEDTRGSRGKMDPSAPLETNVVNAITAGWMTTLAKALFSRDRDVAFGNAYIEAMQAQAYLGKDLADPKVKAEARRWAKSMFAVRALSQMFSPYTATTMPFGKEQVDAYRELRTKHGPEVGTVEFLKKYGDKAFAYTVAKSKPTEGATVAASKEADRWYQDNKGFFEQHKLVAGYFTRDMEGEFDPNAFGRQKQRGQREDLPPVEWVADAMYRLGNRAYYDDAKPEYERIIEERGQAEATVWLKQKRAEIDAKYPGWAMAWSDWSQRAQKRTASLEALEIAIEDPLVADTPTAKAAREFLDIYSNAMIGLQRRGFVTLRSDRLGPVRAALAKDAKAIMARHGSRGFEAIYEYLFRNELEEYVPGNAPDQALAERSAQSTQIAATVGGV